MAAPAQDAPAVLRVEQNGSVLLEIADSDGEVRDYLVEAAPPGFAVWAVTLRRLDGEGGPYRVERLPGRWSCDCRDSKFRARTEARSCKHKVAVRGVYELIRRLSVHVREPHHQEEAGR